MSDPLEAMESEFLCTLHSMEWLGDTPNFKSVQTQGEDMGADTQKETGIH